MIGHGGLPRPGTASIIAYLLGQAATVAAQAVTADTRAASGGSPPVPEVRVAAPISVSASPPSFETIAVTRPADFLPNSPVAFVVQPTGSMQLLGPMAGRLTGAGSVLLTIAVPRRSRAGTMEVARVRFESVGVPSVEVPVLVTVAPVFGIDLAIVTPVSTVRRGDRFLLRYRLTNTGNRPESVTVTTLLPSGWRASGPDRPSTGLAVGERVEQTLEIDIPDGSATGNATVRLLASIEGRPVATADASVTVLAGEQSMLTGPLLTTRLLMAEGTQGALWATSLSIAGPLTPGISISGDVGTWSGAAANPALARIGGYERPPVLRLNAPRWDLTLGQAGHRFSDLTGDNLSGVGGLVAIRGAGWRATTLLARPGAHRARTGAGGALTGARLEVDAGPVLFSATAAGLEERAFESRRLGVVSLGAALPSVWNGSLSAEVAHRTFAAGTGLGYLTRFDRRTRRDHLSVHLVHAPGGRAAFAQATTRMGVMAGRALTDDLAIHGGYWSSRDDAAASVSTLASDGWTAGTTLRLASALTVGLLGRHARFAARSSTGRFGNVDQDIEANLDLSTSIISVRSRIAIGNIHRETIAGGDAPLQEHGRRLTADGTVGIRSPAGFLSLTGRHERSDAGLGALPMLTEVGARAEGVPLLTRGPIHVRATGEVRRLHSHGFGSSRTMALASLTADLPAGFSLAVAAERNPYLISSTGAGAWIYGVRFERSTRLPRLAQAVTHGVVYHDLDGDGVRDAGEPGVRGAQILTRSGSVTSKQNGEFRIRGTGVTGSLDPHSLRTGLMAGASRIVSGRQEIGVIAVAPVWVHLSINDADGLGLGSELLAPVVVMARHASGTVWVARQTAKDRAVFDALPPGDYALELDLLDVTTPLSVSHVLPTFTIGEGVPPTVQRVVLEPRRLRIRQFNDQPRRAARPAP